MSLTKKGEKKMNHNLELITELKNSLPSKRMLQVVSAAIVDVGDTTFILKNRGPEYILLKYADFTYYNENHGSDLHYDYDEIARKNVRFDLNLFGERGKRAVDIWQDHKNFEQYLFQD